MMKPRALISDVHANLEAFQAVLGDIDGQGIGEIISLGDVIGYGPRPVECARLARARCRLELLGNHDHAVLTGEWGHFNPVAVAATEWTARQLREASDAFALIEHLQSLRPSADLEGWLLAHGSPYDPLEEYIFPADVETDGGPAKLRKIFEALPGAWGFVGHTHQAGVFVDDGTIVRFHWADEFPDGFVLPAGSRAIVNVGSVGQPRDHDPNSCYVLFDGQTVRWRRVQYRIEVTAAEIRAIPELDDYLATRLAEGR